MKACQSRHAQGLLHQAHPGEWMFASSNVNMACRA